ncbi:MAG: LptF/LptG family permease, partial [Alphaproteobacteria bacterium]|nr:LptF/LptG family permease [Alphaproteobacteria bacterium]
MKKLDIYICKQIIIGFLLVCFSLMSILWLSQSLRFLDLISSKGITAGIFVELTSLLMPRIFTILAPISLFASVLFVYHRMLADQELVVMKAAGIEPRKLAKPAIIIGALMVGINIYVMNIGIPKAEIAFKDLEWKVKNNLSHLMFREGEFTSLQQNLTVFISEHEKDGTAKGILISDERNP